MTDRIWVVANGGDFNKVLDPLVQIPTLGGASIANPTLKEKITYTFPNGVDPFHYLVELKGIDPLLLVTRKSDLQIAGLHRYGYVWVDLKKRTYTSIFPVNDKGMFFCASPTRRTFDLIRSDFTMWPQSLTLPNTVGNMDDQGPLTLSMMNRQLIAFDVGDRVFNGARIAEVTAVDWKTIYRTTEEKVYNQLEALEKVSDKANPFDDLASLGRAGSDYLLSCAGQYDRPFLWIADKDPWAHLELYAFYRLIPPMVVTEQEKVYVIDPVKEGFAPHEFHQAIEKLIEEKRFDELYRNFLRVDAYLKEAVFIPKNHGKYISEFIAESPEPVG